MATESNLRAWEDTGSFKYLHMSMKAFNEGKKAEGFVIFGPLCLSPLEHAQTIYGFLWIIKGQPGLPENGRFLFHDLNGLSSTTQEKARAISQYLKGISMYNTKAEGARHALLDSRLAAAKLDEPSLQEYLQVGAVLVGGLATVVSVSYALFSAFKGTGGSIPAMPKPSVPGHIVVGGGHMDFANHIAIGGGHLNNTLKSIKESGAQLGSTKSTADRVRIENCVMEYPTPSDLRESDARYENEQLERIHRDYNEALWKERQFGTPVDHERFTQEIQRLADSLGKESWKALLFAIGESMAAGCAIEYPPVAIFEGYQAFEDFKKFGALAEEAERLRDLADRWGK